MVSGGYGPAHRRFVLASAVAGSLALVAAVLLLPGWPVQVRRTASSAGLILAVAFGVPGAVLRIRRVRGRERRAWILLIVAGVIAVLGNLWVAAIGADPVTSPSVVSDASIALALAISTAGLLAFPSPRRRGPELTSMFLDGVVAGGALLIIVSVLVYSELLVASVRGDNLGGLLAVVVPVLDVVLATVSVLLILRARPSQRLTFGLVAAGFLLYAVADLTYAVRLARGTFEYGSLLDLGWIVGYLTFGLAAWAPRTRPDHAREPGAGRSDALGTVLVFAVLAIAAVVQIGFGAGGPQSAQVVVWGVVVLAAGARQVLLSIDNSRLHRGLERRVAEQTQDLRRLARQNQLLLESVGDGIYGVDRDGLITFLNPSASMSLGYPLAQVAGQGAQDVFHAPALHRPIDDPAADPSWAGSPVARAMREQVVVVSDDEVYRRADGTEFPVDITAAPVIEDGQVLGAVVVFRDVTQRREVDRMKNEFLSVVSHELRTPLTSIRASLELIEGGHLGEVPAGAAPLITVALESSERLTRLINDLLDIERIESGDRPLQLVSLEAHGLLVSAADQIGGLADSLGVRIEVGAADGVVLGDEDQLLQTLLNLLGNACKFSEAGSTVVLGADAEGSWVTFGVRDQGRGIPADKLESVFDRFGQVDSSDTRLQGGTGLGLAISRGIVHRHGGEIWAESVLGAGTTVSFTVPRSRRGEAPTPWSYAAPVAVPGQEQTVLVCDDDPAVVTTLSAVLRTGGYRPVGLTDGAQVAEVLATEQPDLVLLDLMMPGTTGAEVLDVVRADPARAATPVVVVSGMGPAADPAVARATEDWLVKPVSEQRLVDTVAQILAVGRGPARPTVLLVEDDESMAAVLGTRLDLAGLHVVRAGSATEAVQRGQEVTPDLVVLDLELPDGTGHDVVRELRRRGTLASIPMIVYSARDIGTEERADLRLGETRFFEKSRTTPGTLVRHVLDLAAATGAGTDPPTDTAGQDRSEGGARRGGDTDT